jgi:hypothetical protein
MSNLVYPAPAQTIGFGVTVSAAEAATAAAHS